MEKIYKPKLPDTMALSRKQAIGKTIGNFLILENGLCGKIKAKCLLCNNTIREYNFYKVKTGHTTSCGCKQKLVNPEQYLNKKFNKLTVIEICSHKDLDGAILAKVKCDCGNVSEKRLNTILRNKIRSCGCMKNTVLSNMSVEVYDMDRYNKLLDIWRQMIKRCYQSGDNELIKKSTSENLWKMLLDKPQHTRYIDYGKRGISVCKEWHTFDNFYKWYKDNIRVGESIDRIYNDGNYEPGNCRSGSNKEQNLNQRVRKDNVSGYKGIRYTGFSYQWYIKDNGKRFNKEGFKLAEIAVIERNIYIMKNQLPHSVQSLINNKKVSIHLSVLDKKYHIGYPDLRYNTLILSTTAFDNRNDTIALKVCELMNQPKD